MRFFFFNFEVCIHKIPNFNIKDNILAFCTHYRCSNWAKKIRGVPFDLWPWIDLEKKSKLSKSNSCGISSWQSLQFDVLINKIRQPSCWPSILSPSKIRYFLNSQRSRPSDLVDWYVKMLVLFKFITMKIF